MDFGDQVWSNGALYLEAEAHLVRSNQKKPVGNESRALSTTMWSDAEYSSSRSITLWHYLEVVKAPAVSCMRDIHRHVYDRNAVEEVSAH